MVNSEQNEDLLLTECIKKLESVSELSLNIYNECVESRHIESYETTILLLFRHMIEMFDAVPLLLSVGCIEPSKPILRSIYEALLSLKYILNDAKQIKRRALSLYVSHIKNDIKLNTIYSTAKPGGRLHKIVNSNKNYNALTRNQNNNSVLSHHDLQEINREWDRISKNSGKNQVTNWYSLFSGPKSLRSLAIHLDTIESYEILYRKWSSVSHANDIFNNVVLSDEKLVVKNLRSREGYEGLAYLSIVFLFDSSFQVCKHFISNEQIIKKYFDEFFNKISEFNKLFPEFKINLPRH